MSGILKLQFSNKSFWVASVFVTFSAMRKSKEKKLRNVSWSSKIEIFI